jgi:hypothetical protein
MAVDKDRLYKKLDHVGEHAVRENIANGVYGENRRELVEEWLEQFQDDLVSEAVEEEALELVREASESIREEIRLATPETTPDQWYRRPLGILGLIALATLVYYLIYFFVRR